MTSGQNWTIPEAWNAVLPPSKLGALRPNCYNFRETLDRYERARIIDRSQLSLQYVCIEVIA